MKFAANNTQDTVFRYMYAGAAFADASEYRPCIALWNYALSLKVCKETLLSCDTSFTARAIVQLYVNVMARDGFSREGDDGDEESEESMNDRGAVDFREVMSIVVIGSIDLLIYFKGLMIIFYWAY